MMARRRLPVGATGLRAMLAVALVLGVLSGLHGAEAQESAIPRIGFVRPGSPPDPFVDALRRGLRDLGYEEGRTIAIEYRWAGGNPERIPALTAELVRLNVRVIVTSGDPGVPAAKRATRRIPVVFAVHADPVGAGLVASLARPGGNVTGLSSMTAELGRKRLELLKEAFPQLSRIAVLRDPRQPVGDLQLTETAAGSLGLRLHVLTLREIDELEAVLAAARQGQADALINLQSAFFYAHRERIVEAVSRTRLPTMYHHRAFVDAGGLMAYAPDFSDLFRRAATYVDRILKGADPADLPVEQPTKFELVINLKTAKALGVTIPQSLLIRADRVVRE
jgi:putative ABC transport system substrate-binding protein